MLNGEINNIPKLGVFESIASNILSVSDYHSYYHDISLPGYRLRLHMPIPADCKTLETEKQMQDNIDNHIIIDSFINTLLTYEFLF